MLKKEILTMDLIMNKPANVIIICGPICSGKSTFAKTLVNHRHIEVGDIVRKIKQTDERIHDVGLAYLIISELTQELSKKEDVVITGIRQLPIYEEVLKICNAFYLLTETLWLDVPYGVLFQRYIDRNDSKDNRLDLRILSPEKRFNDALISDNYIGLKALKNYLLTQTTTKVIKNYDTDTVQKS